MGDSKEKVRNRILKLEIEKHELFILSFPVSLILKDRR